MRSTCSSGVDGNAVVLVVHLCAINDDVGAGADIEAVGVVAKTVSVTSRVVNGHVGDGESIAASNRDGLNRGVFDADISDGRVAQTVQGKEL